MKRMTRWTFSLAAASAVAGSSVFAQDIGVGGYANPIAFGVFAGASIPTGDFSDLASTGWHAGGLLQWNSPTLPFGFRFDAAYHGFGDKDNNNANPRIISGTLNGVLTFPMVESTTRPYLILGAGLYNEDERCTGCEAKTKFGLNGGLGVTVPLSGFSTMIEGRAHIVLDSQAGTSNKIFIPISVGLLFR